MRLTTIAFFMSSLIYSQGFNPTNTNLKQLETILETYAQALLVAAKKQRMQSLQKKHLQKEKLQLIRLLKNQKLLKN